jgi:hypothetical protein
LETNTAAGASRARRDLAAPATSGTYFSRFYFRANDVTPSSTVSIAFLYNNAAGTVSMNIQLLTTGKIRLLNGMTSTTTDGATILSVDTWYRLESRILLSDSVGEIEVRLYLQDSTTALDTLSITGEDTFEADLTRFYYGKGASGNAGALYRYDDIAINDTTGSFQTSWPGPGKIAMLVPAAEGATINYTPLSGTDNALMVDEMPAAAPDDLTSYNESTTAAHLDILTLTDMPAEVPAGATIILADAWGRVGGDATTGSPIMRFNLYDEADVKTAGPNCNKVDLNGFQIIATNEHCVLDTAGKTKANLDSFKVGYEIVTDTAVLQRVTAVWVNVEWSGVVGADGASAGAATVASVAAAIWAGVTAAAGVAASVVAGAALWATVMDSAGTGVGLAEGEDIGTPVGGGAGDFYILLRRRRLES